MATETTTMQAGPELDALVARTVMNAPTVHTVRECDRLPEGAVYIEGWSASLGNPGQDRAFQVRSGGDRYWSPSTSPAAAWQVVEAMRSKGWHPLVNWLGRDRKCWHCYFEHESSPVLIVDTEGNRWNDDEIRGAHAYADTMPEAVCRAALSALATRPRT